MLVTKVSVFLQGLADNSFEFWGNVGIEPDRGHGHFFKNGIKDDTGTPTTEWQSTCCHFVEHDTKRKQVCPSIQILRPNLLWRHVRNCPQCTTGACQVVYVYFLRCQGLRIGSRDFCGTHFGESKVQNLGVSAVRYENVGGLDVAVNDAFGVRSIEGVGNFDGDPQKGFQFKWTTSNCVFQSLALQKLHGDERPAVFFTDIMNGADIWMVQRGSRLGFPSKSLQCLAIPR